MYLCTYILLRLLIIYTRIGGIPIEYILYSISR